MAKVRRKSEKDSPEDFQKILSLISDHTNIDFTNYKATTVTRRLQRQMRMHKQKSLAVFAKYLEANPNTVKTVCSDILIHVTEFFRDPDTYEALRKKIFPKLFATLVSNAPLRIWVPGCSTGQEAYSIAILLSEFADQQKQKISFQIFATDIAEHVVEKARSGFYLPSELKGVSKTRLERFFEPVKGGYRIKGFIRDMCVFSRHDLTRNPPFAKIDLISCRNVLIYFASDLQKQVIPVFHYALNPSGFLWLGRSEGPSGISKLFTLISNTHKIFSKINTATPMSYRFQSGRLANKIEIKRPNIHALADKYQELDRLAITRYAPAAVMINADMEIIQVRGNTSPFLSLPTGQPTYNLLKMVRTELLSALRMAVESARQKNLTARKEGLVCGVGRDRKKVNIEVVPVNAHLPLKERQFAIFFEESQQEKKATSQKRPLKKKEEENSTAYIAELLQEVDSLREYQHSLAEGYEAAQEELTSSNEELQSTLEEFQSTNEELETAKEELQASNEELTTVNDELQSRNEELVALNEKYLRSEERFRMMVEAVKDYAIFMLDPNGKIASWNEGARRLKGYEATEIIGKHFSVFYGEEDVKNGKPKWELKEALQKGRLEDEGWRVRKDGSQFWANVVITRLSDDQGNLIGFTKVTRDLTERKRAEENLREGNESLEIRVKDRTLELQASEQRLRQFIEKSPYAVAMLDRNLRYIFASQQWITDYRLSTVNLRGMSHYELFPEVPERWKQVHQRCLNGAIERNDAEQFVRKDGTIDWIRWEIRPWHDKDGNVGGILIFTENIADRLKSEALLGVISNTIPAFVTYIDTQERYCFANDAYLSWIGKTREQVIGRTAREILGSEVYAKAIPNMLKAFNGEYVVYDLPWKSALGGGERIFQIEYVPDISPEKTVNGYVMHGQDVTDLRRAIQARDEFLAVASHELKTPLATLKLRLQLAAASIDEESLPKVLQTEMSDAFSISIRQVNSLTNLVEDLLDVSRIQNEALNLSFTRFDLSQLTKELIDGLAEQLRAAGCTSKLDLEPNLEGSWDKRRIEQIIINLISNAMKYAPKSAISIIVRREREFAKLIVQDTGPGMSEEIQNKIFNRFERAPDTNNVGGMGLGLYIVRKIVDAHCGSIHVESRLGEGSKFTVNLPIGK